MAAPYRPAATVRRGQGGPPPPVGGPCSTGPAICQSGLRRPLPSTGRRNGDPMGQIRYGAKTVQRSRRSEATAAEIWSTTGHRGGDRSRGRRRGAAAPAVAGGRAPRPPHPHVGDHARLPHLRRRLVPVWRPATSPTPAWSRASTHLHADDHRAVRCSAGATPTASPEDRRRLGPPGATRSTPASPAWASPSASHGRVTEARGAPRGVEARLLVQGLAVGRGAGQARPGSAARLRREDREGPGPRDDRGRGDPQGGAPRPHLRPRHRPHGRPLNWTERASTQVGRIVGPVPGRTSPPCTSADDLSVLGGEATVTDPTPNAWTTGEPSDGARCRQRRCTIIDSHCGLAPPPTTGTSLDPAFHADFDGTWPAAGCPGTGPRQPRPHHGLGDRERGRVSAAATTPRSDEASSADGVGRRR